MKKLLAVSLLTTAVCLAAKAEGEYVFFFNEAAEVNWSDTTHWYGETKPPADGAATVIISNDVGSAWRRLNIDEDANVYKIVFMQSANGNTGVNVYGPKTLTIGAGGIDSKSYLVPYKRTGAGDGRPPKLYCPIKLSASQEWWMYYDSMGDLDWYSSVYGDFTGAKDVDLLLGGGKWNFLDGSSTNFTGRTIICKEGVQLGTASQFNRLGRQIVMVDTNCYAHAYLAAQNKCQLFFRHTASGVGYVDSEIYFDCTNTTAVGPQIMPNTEYDASFETRTVFRGAWKGAFRGYNELFCGNGDQYNQGLHMNDGTAGSFRPETSQTWFQNDNSELTIVGKSITSGNTYFQPKSVWFVFDGPNSLGKDNAVWGFYISKGRPNRLQGLMCADGMTFNSPYIQHAEVNLANGPSAFGAIQNYGIMEPGSCTYDVTDFRAEGMKTTNGGEMPIWIYNVPGGTSCFKRILNAITAGGNRQLPLNIWGGGTAVFDMTAGSSFEPGHYPIWIRDGALVATKKDAVKTVRIQLGVSHPAAFTVRAMTMARPTNVSTYDTKTLTFTKAFAPDGVTLAAGDKVLVNVPNGDKGMYNGIYEVADSLSWTRIAELDEGEEVVPDIRVSVTEGNLWAGTTWFLVDEVYHIRERFPSTALQDFNDKEYCLAFFQERDPNMDVSFLTENATVIQSAITVPENQSSGRSILGGRTAHASGFTGTISATKRTLTFTAAEGGTVTVSGVVSATNGIEKIGDGEVVIAASALGGDTENPTYVVTNLMLSAGKLTLPSAALAAKLSSAEFEFTDGATAELNLSGDVDLTGWTFTVTGLVKPEDRDNPPTFAFKVTSADGTVTGTPTVVLTGTDPRNWSAVEADGVWKVRYTKPGLLILLK